MQGGRGVNDLLEKGEGYRLTHLRENGSTEGKKRGHGGGQEKKGEARKKRTRNKGTWKKRHGIRRHEEKKGGH